MTPFTGFEGPKQPPSMVGTHFDVEGEGKHYNARNVHGQQFNTGSVRGKVMKGVESHTRSQYFRRAGLGAAMRYTLGMQQVPSHVSDFLNARTHGQRQTGKQPQPMYVQATPEQEEESESGAWKGKAAENRTLYRRAMRNPQEEHTAYRRAMGFPEAPFTDIRKATP
jgi:hypothetical protein